MGTPAANSSPAADDEINGHLQLRLDDVTTLEANGYKIARKATIARFNWELAVFKGFSLHPAGELNTTAERGLILALSNNADAASAKADIDEEQEKSETKPEPFLSVNVACVENKLRTRGWRCTANVKITLTGPKKTRCWNIMDVRFPGFTTSASVRVGWGALAKDYMGPAEAKEDWIEITAAVSITEQIGYGLMPLNDVLIVKGARLVVNKPYLAAFSSFFRTMFFANHAGMLANDDSGEHQINDPTDNLDAFKLMIRMAMPDGGRPDDNSVIDVLHLSDKYDLPNVTEICENFLIYESRLPNIQKLGLADQYKLLNLKKRTLDKINPSEFCQLLDESVQVYNELSPTMRQALGRQMKRKSANIANAAVNAANDGPTSSKRLRLELEDNMAEEIASLENAMRARRDEMCSLQRARQLHAQLQQAVAMNRRQVPAVEEMRNMHRQLLQQMDAAINRGQPPPVAPAAPAPINGNNNNNPAAAPPPPANNNNNNDRAIVQRWRMFNDGGGFVNNNNNNVGGGGFANGGFDGVAARFREMENQIRANRGRNRPRQN